MSIKKGPKGPDYLLPPEVLTMMNIFIEAKSQIVKLCALETGDLVRTVDYLEMTTNFGMDRNTFLLIFEIYVIKISFFSSASIPHSDR